MAGKFMGLISQRTASKAMAMIMIVLLGIAIYATRTISEEYEDNEEWTIWRNADFAVSVVSLLFTSFLLYGTISEFRLFIFLWIPWNVILVGFWTAFVIRKHDEFLEWERIFRIIAIVLMAIAEIPVCTYYSSLKERIRDPESATAWPAKESDQAYKTLGEQSSASLHSVFKTKLANENIGFQEETNVQTKARGSTSSDESEGIEMKERESEPESPTPSPPPNEPEIAATAHVDMTEISQNDSTAASSQDTEDSAEKESDGTDVTSETANAAEQANSESSTEDDGSSTASDDDDVANEDESDFTWPPAPVTSETETDSKL